MSARPFSLHKIIVGLCGVFLACASPAAPLQWSTPESEGISSAAIDAWLTACERELDALHGFVLLRHGKVVAEGWWKPFSAERTHQLFSVSKSVTSTAVGLLVDDGKVDLDETMADVFPDLLPAEPSARLKAVRVRDLLTMTSGMKHMHLKAAEMDCDWVARTLASDFTQDPGRVFRYDSYTTHLLAALVERRSGKPLMDFLSARLFKPIGIERAWSNVSPTGVACGGWAMNMTTRELARFGQLLLQEGRWGDRQIVSRDWVRLATAKQTVNKDSRADWRQGYGFQFWRCKHDAYRAAGARGQLVLVMPEQDAVLAVHASLGKMAHELNLVWKHLLRNMRQEPLPENPAAHAALARRCAKLTLPPLGGADELPRDVCGKTYSLAPVRRLNFTSVRIDPAAGGWIVVFTRDAGTEVRIPVGNGAWHEGSAIFEEARFERLGAIIGTQPMASSGGWTGRTFRTRTYLQNTVFRLDLNFDFAPDGQLVLEVNLTGMDGVREKSTGMLLQPERNQEK